MTEPTATALRKTILIIEDDPRVIDLYEEHLETGQVRLRSATNYRDATETPISEIDLIVADGDLGEGSGHDGPAAVEALRDRGYKGPVLFCSGQDLSAAAERLDAEAYLKSHFIEVFAKIRRIIDGPSEARTGSQSDA